MSVPIVLLIAVYPENLEDSVKRYRYEFVLQA